MNKFCNKCKTEKSLDEFYKCTAAKDGLSNRCAECDKNIRKQTRLKYKNAKKIIPQTKKCCTCKNKKNSLEFSKNSNTKDGLASRCKKCVKEYSDKLANSKKEIPKRKTCAKCKKDYGEEFFHRNSRKASGLSSYCKTCVAHRAKKDVKKIRDRARQRYHKNYGYKISRLLRSRIRSALKGISKSKKTMELIGCNIDFFIKYIESKFEDGMSWDNYGYYGWHVDHIIPCASFDLSDEEQQKECFHYTNLQPMWGEENIRKSDLLDWSEDDARGIRFRDS